jgi:hypothetical protein
LVLLFKEKNVRVEFTEKISFNEDVAQDDKYSETLETTITLFILISVNGTHLTKNDIEFQSSFDLVWNSFLNCYLSYWELKKLAKSDGAALLFEAEPALLFELIYIITIWK